MTDWIAQRTWDDVTEGDRLPDVSFPLPVHRLAVQAGANYDFSPGHHNPDVATAQGAADVYANNVFLLGMWERSVREYIGLAGVITRIGPFRMNTFTVAGETVVVSGVVGARWRDGERALVRIDLTSRTSAGVTVSGSVTATLPRRQS